MFENIFTLRDHDVSLRDVAWYKLFVFIGRAPCLTAEKKGGRLHKSANAFAPSQHSSLIQPICDAISCGAMPYYGPSLVITALLLLQFGSAPGAAQTPQTPLMDGIAGHYAGPMVRHMALPILPPKVHAFGPRGPHSLLTAIWTYSLLATTD